MSYLFTDEWGTYYDMDRIILPLEGFPAEIEALEVALYLAECSRAVVKLFHTEEHDERKEQIFESLRDLAVEKAGRMRVRVEEEVCEDNPVDAILTRAEDHDLIIMGGKRRFREEIFGSVSSNVIRRAQRPVVIVTAPVDEWKIREEPIRRLLIPLRNVVEDRAAVKLAATLTSSATVRDFEMAALHVLTLPQTTPISAYSENMKEDERQFFKEVGELTRLIARPITPNVIVGRNVGRSIVSFAEEHRSDIIILGEREKPGPFTRLLGTEALYVRRNAPCSVVLIYRP
ncbi:MAG: universal stress protein [Nitrososphaeria archaeon]|nr:universal stress protein [Nitrososphaeria archaeon]NIN53484.1 universal stress protein [Nitrososphaeria archaeon]NIQ34001.1 universal stress protein [Nitrososphaeria archaeon]